MTQSYHKGLRWLQTSILLALGVTPIAACKTTVVIDCSEATEQANGLVDCGLVSARPKPTACSMPASGTATECSEFGECQQASDCSSGTYPRCDASQFGDCMCARGCTVDQDCLSGEACLCGDDGGRCVEAACKTSDDCDGGQSCILFTDPGACETDPHPAFACTSNNDQCLSDSQCPSGLTCYNGDDHFRCVYGSCNVGGRPFYIEGELRTAPIVRSTDWAASLRPSVSDLAPSEREALARRWGRIGQLEHASVASFARFALQLLSLGAPPDLIEQTTSAMADESLHTRLAFGLASAYAGSPVGPGNLDVGGVLESNDVGSIVRTLIHEGCVGETFAAALAREERARTTDPVVHKVLDRIAADEARHALLAFRALAWLVEQSPRSVEAAATLSAEMHDLAQEVSSFRAAASPSPSPKAASTGVPRSPELAESELAQLRVAVLSTVVLPAASALLARGQAAPMRAAA